MQTRWFTGLAAILAALIGCGGSGGDGGATTGSDNGAVSADTTALDTPASPDESEPPPDVPPVPTGPIVDLRVDTNRDGVVDVDGKSDEAGEETWDAAYGAVFMANIDDDQLACEPTGSDIELAKCNDAADEAINGEEDLPDLAHLFIQAWPDAPDDAQGHLTVTEAALPFVRFFVRQVKNNPLAFLPFNPATGALTAAQLREGVELLIEGKDIVKDSDVWDGYVDVTLDVAGGKPYGTDKVRMRIAPVMTYHHLLPAETVYATSISQKSSLDFRTDLKEAIKAAGLANDLYPVMEGDQWTQDFFETAYMSMPAAGGKQHAIRVNYRSANVQAPSNKNNPLRTAGRFVFTALRGPDSAGIQHFDIKHTGYMDSLNSFGNTETIPPYSKDGIDYPLGRLFRGSVPTMHPDPLFSKMLESQKQQPQLYVDTSWLVVGHVDETISFIRADTPRGWTIVANDVKLCMDMLQAEVDKGNGDVTMFNGLKWSNGKSAQVSISGVLADEAVMADSAKALAAVDKQLEILLDATGVTPEEVIHIPYLHHDYGGASVAYSVGTVNGISITPTLFGAPDPHGPIIDGKDIFKVQMEEAFAKVGVTVTWVEDWSLYHILLGEVHCGSNATRAIPEVKWWETGR